MVHLKKRPYLHRTFMNVLQQNYCCHKYFAISFLPWSNDTNIPTRNSHMDIRVVSHITGLPHSYRQAECYSCTFQCLQQHPSYNFTKWIDNRKCIHLVCVDEVNSPIFLPTINQIWIFFTDFHVIPNIKFHGNIYSVEAVLIYMDRWTDGYDKANRWKCT